MYLTLRVQENKLLGNLGNQSQLSFIFFLEDFLGLGKLVGTVLSRHPELLRRENHHKLFYSNAAPQSCLHCLGRVHLIETKSKERRKTTWDKSG